MKTHLEFRSDQFAAYADDGEEPLDPTLWGKCLAEFLRDYLPGEGFETAKPTGDSQGWVVPIVNKEFPLSIVCANYVEQPDGYLCIIYPDTPTVRKFLRDVDTRPMVSALQEAVDRLLSEDMGVHEKQWFTREEFMESPPRR